MTIQLAHQQLLLRLVAIYDRRETATIADLVMEHITTKKKAARLLDKSLPLTAAQLDQLANISQQLVQHRPIQYVLGEAWFAGMKFYVNEHTLIPRPETEELVDLVARSHGSGACRILDIGTGSGCIPVALKKKIPQADVISIDVSEGALKVATQNAAVLEADIQLLLLDFLKEDNWNRLPLFDVIVSNPPYIKQSEATAMEKRVLDFEPPIALFVPDNDALVFYRKIAAFGKTHLTANGMIFVEINETLGKEVAVLFEEEGYQTQIKHDLQRKDRFIKAVARL